MMEVLISSEAMVARAPFDASLATRDLSANARRFFCLAAPAALREGRHTLPTLQ